MLWHKAWLETRWRFIIALLVLTVMAGAKVYEYMATQRLLPQLTATLDTSSLEKAGIAGAIREAIELQKDFRGFIWYQGFRDNLTQMGVFFAVLLGCGRAAVETAAEYARTRHQFGRPIGEFQAVKHRLADALGGLAFAEPVLHAAALAFDRALPDATRDAATAKLVAADAARSAVTAALQVHGAIGYTDEHPLSLWLRRVTALRAAWGTPDAHRELVAAALAAGDTGHLGQPPDPLPSTTTGATVAAGQEATVAAGRGA